MECRGHVTAVPLFSFHLALEFTVALLLKEASCCSTSISTSPADLYAPHRSTRNVFQHGKGVRPSARHLQGCCEPVHKQDLQRTQHRRFRFKKQRRGRDQRHHQPVVQAQQVQQPEVRCGVLLLQVLVYVTRDPSAHGRRSERFAIAGKIIGANNIVSIRFRNYYISH